MDAPDGLEYPDVSYPGIMGTGYGTHSDHQTANTNNGFNVEGNEFEPMDLNYPTNTQEYTSSAQSQSATNRQTNRYGTGFDNHRWSEEMDPSEWMEDLYMNNIIRQFMTLPVVPEKSTNVGLVTNPQSVIPAKKESIENVRSTKTRKSKRKRRKSKRKSTRRRSSKRSRSKANKYDPTATQTQ